MTGREREILEHLRKNPMISQNELADTLGLARSSIGVHIANLMKKGYILGKGYIVKEGDYVCVIGGSNIDIQGKPQNPLVYKDSNIGEVNISLGGVGRNIAENLVKMGVDTRLITVIGDDIYGQKILDEARHIGLNMTESLILKGASTSTYLSILDHTSDMVLAISHMNIYDRMTIDFIKGKSHVIENAAFCVLDTNLPREVIEYIVTTFKETKFILDTVSTAKAQKVKDLIGYFHTVKPNRIEAEILTGVSIETTEDAKDAANVLHQRGVEKVFISLGEQGVLVSDRTECFIAQAPKVKIISATGAGDAFIAALVLGLLLEMDNNETAQLALAASAIALSHENTINPMMSRETLYEKVKEIKSC